MSAASFIAPLAASILIALPAAASAQIPGWQSVAGNSPGASARYAEAAQAPYFEARRTAYDRGYREGIKEGEKDARRGDRFAFQDEKEFQRADRGYNRNLGDRERYRQVFRDGYAAGYSDGYSRNSRYGRSGAYGRPGTYGRQGPYGQQGPYGSWGGPNTGRYPQGGYYSPAFDNGTRDGYEKGLEDARKNRSFDPVRHSWYRSGDRHYDDDYGSRDQYKNVYRQGFQRGYERGYQEGRYRR
jgi:flagellar biosynthesis/type III secretory pathway protein FliH